MSKRAYERRVIAYHEAGHAVVARKLGVEIVSVDMIGDDVRLAMVHGRSEVESSDPVATVRALNAHLMMALAGSVAQRLAGYPDNDDELADDIDVTVVCAYRLARIEAELPIRPGPDEDAPHPNDRFHTAGMAITQRAVNETIDLLQNNWQAVVRVAGALVKRDRLTQAELDRIIAEKRQ